MLRHQHHTMQNQLRDQNRMGGPMRPMQQANMAPSHQPQHPLSHRNPHAPHQQQLPMPPHQHVHPIQHVGNPQGNPRQPVLMGISSQNRNGGAASKIHRPMLSYSVENLELLFGSSGCIEGMMANVGLKEQGGSVGSVATQTIQGQYQQQPNNLNIQQATQAQQQQNTEPNKSPTNEANGESKDDNNSSTQNHANVTNPNLANMKEKTPMCLVNELARFNKIQHQYRLTHEQGPAHNKRFTVTLKLGEEEYVADGPSIKKAQHSAATEALTTTWYRHPPPKPAKAMRIGNSGKCSAGSGHLPPTVELNTLAMRRGEPTVYAFRHAPPAPPQQFVAHGFGNFPRMFNPRYPTYNRGFHAEPQGLYHVTLKVGEREFVGRGMTGQAARHDAASRALEQLRQLPLPDEVANTCATTENRTLGGIDDPNAELKSPVSLVHETALKHGLPVYFEMVSESGKPHIRTFMTKCTVGDKVTLGEGASKKVSKKRAAELMLEELKQLPPLPVTIQNQSLQRLRRRPPATKKKSRNLIKVYQEPRTESEATTEVNPISRLVQIQQAKREKEPVYNLIEEKGAPRRREFVMEVTMGPHSAQGIGPNKKLAKRAAAEALLTQLGYSKPQPQPTKPSIKTGETENTEGKPRKVTFLEEEQINENQNHPVGGTTGRQLVPGLLLVDAGQESKMGGGPSVQIVAEELRGQQQQQSPSGVSPRDQLKYLAQLLNFHVEFSDFPKGMYKEYLSLVSLNTDPPQVCHGHGPTKNASRDQAALTALRTLSKLGLDSVTNSQNKKDKGASGDGIHVNNQVKNNILNGATDK
ncbi:double-stranded RNA-binding protein Staufen homolog 2 isoform X2 [Cephus cinctus]|uniref:Double-stranded RNA-binding protein Staufen homolog 2 isoform X2 n=1 Tax=Cephus cinctus TaxID=211228 RepID=A0AAJ7CA64_CEPCN|nr:double-stranded RNA-binding protein Staufen homolog 2 isoform X2 [Cephus cinctus]